ncbi:MAG TPA: hypothetical protein VKX40_16795 [Aequorivita sp.]|nr:hypothetical protein [Aequorivita sp.]
MRSRLFDFRGTLPAPENTFASVYKTSNTIEPSHKSVSGTIENLSRIFGITGPTSNLGDTLQVRERSKVLTVYPFSDSFWYYDADLFANENILNSQNLPDPKSARVLANEFLGRNKLLQPNAQLMFHSYSTVTSKNIYERPNIRDKTSRLIKTQRERVKEYNTEIHLHYQFQLDNLPVYGPGAKTRLSFADPQTISGLYHFWRNPIQTKEKRRLLNPELALELFSRNPRFAQLEESSAQVIISEMEYGYYALPPREIQNYLLPVYIFHGTVTTKKLPSYEFTLYMVSVRYTDNEIKEMGVDIGMTKTIVF